jgi:hypothetical protein
MLPVRQGSCLDTEAETVGKLPGVSGIGVGADVF